MKCKIDQLTVKKLIEELKKLPPDAIVWAYEGEVSGIVVGMENDFEELAFFETRC